MKIILLCAFFFVLANQGFGQLSHHVEGLAQDSLGNPIPGASVKLLTPEDTMITVTDERGLFAFKNVKAKRLSLAVSTIGFHSFNKSYALDDNKPVFKVPAIILAEAFNFLDEVEITGVHPVTVMEDTIAFDAMAYQVREGDAVEEMVRKLPGMEVSADGNITAQGEPVMKVRLNGKDFFGDDAAAALQNLPADIVQNIQLIDDYGEQANVTGVKNGESQKIININTKPDKRNGYFAKVGGGVGSFDRYSGRLRGNRFKEDQQISVDGSINNTSARSAGLTDARSFKMNYRDNWSEKLTSYGSLRFNNNVNRKQERNASQQFYRDYTRTEDESNSDYNNQSEYKLDWNLEYRPDTANYLKVEPEISYDNSRATGQGVSTTHLLNTSSLRNSQLEQHAKSGSYGIEWFYNHKFAKPGRNLSAGGDLSYADGKEEQEVSNDYYFVDSLGEGYERQHQFRFNHNKTADLRLKASYMEPITEHTVLEASYQWNRSSTDNAKEVNDIDSADTWLYNPQLSNAFNYKFTTNQLGLTWRTNREKFKYNLGLTAQPTVLEGTDLTRNLNTYKRSFNWIPNARFVYRFSKKNQLIAKYNGRSSQPAFNQLQPITDNSDIQNVVTGNPNLKPEYTDNMGLEYRQADWETGYVLFSKLSFSQTRDKIVTTKEIIPDSLKEITTYMNTDGFYTARGNYSISKPFDDRKYTLTYYGNVNYSNNIAFTNNEKNIGKNTEFRQGLKFRIDLDDIIDTELNANYTINSTHYSSSTFDDRRTNQLFIGLRGRNYLFNDWTVGYDFSKTINKGFNATNANPTLLNVYVEYRFFKGNKGTVRLEGFDLFNENTGISRDVFDNEIVDRQSDRLARYFILTFNYRLQKFGS
ncbi:outer membrane beta-barrel family protein [Olivibacter sp. CPCC 100613]|uniref:outer membrane beta-barrel family protein n=1 Tax=Olivibacter sp. CPCC 100613 TaxID=3079931 RepID=UPI002FFC90E7